MNEFLQQLINGLALGAIYALIALGYTMVFGVLRFINFAHGDVFMLGGFAGWLFFAAPEDPSKTGICASLSLESFGQYLFGASPRAFPTVIEDVAIDLPQSWGSLTGVTVTTAQVIV